MCAPHISSMPDADPSHITQDLIEFQGLTDLANRRPSDHQSDVEHYRTGDISPWARSGRTLAACTRGLASRPEPFTLGRSADEPVQLADDHTASAPILDGPRQLLVGGRCHTSPVGRMGPRSRRCQPHPTPAVRQRPGTPPLGVWSPSRPGIFLGKPCAHGNGGIHAHHRRTVASTYRPLRHPDVKDRQWVVWNVLLLGEV